jgi:hypothetical protein
VGTASTGRDLTGGVGKRERKALHPAVRKLCGGRGGAADEEGVKAMLRSIGRCVCGDTEFKVLSSDVFALWFFGGPGRRSGQGGSQRDAREHWQVRGGSLLFVQEGIQEQPTFYWCRFFNAAAALPTAAAAAVCCLCQGVLGVQWWQARGVKGPQVQQGADRHGGRIPGGDARRGLPTEGFFSVRMGLFGEGVFPRGAYWEAA